MLIKITRGVGGVNSRRLLVLTIGLGVLFIVGVIWWRYHLAKPKGVDATTAPPAQVLALGDKARGSSVQVAFGAGEFARVTSPAAARGANNEWEVLAEGSILKVTGAAAVAGEMWVTGIVDGNKSGRPLTVHASFLDRYRPVVLNQLVELFDVRLSIVRTGASSETGVTGWLRNISGQTISQCLVTCVFQDAQERGVDMRRAVATDLPPRELVRFQTGRSDKPFASIAVQIIYATREGLRDSLSTVVIQKSSLE